jgi:hypothetical protein
MSNTVASAFWLVLIHEHNPRPEEDGSLYFPLKHLHASACLIERMVEQI